MTYIRKNVLMSLSPQELLIRIAGDPHNAAQYRDELARRLATGRIKAFDPKALIVRPSGYYTIPKSRTNGYVRPKSNDITPEERKTMLDSDCPFKKMHMGPKNTRFVLKKWLKEDWPKIPDNVQKTLRMARDNFWHDLRNAT